MEINVFNTGKDSTEGTIVTLLRRDSFVGETITLRYKRTVAFAPTPPVFVKTPRRATLPLHSMSIWHRRVLVIPTFVSTEQAVEWGSHLNARQHATLVKKQRELSSSALAECDPQRMVDLATQSQLMREAAEAFVPA